MGRLAFSPFACAGIALALWLATPAGAVEGLDPRGVETEAILIPPGAATAEPETITEEPPASTPDFAPIPTIQYDPAALPLPVRRLREQIMEAAHSGDPEALRPIFDAQDAPPDFGGGASEDPVAYLISLSGDIEGREILAIILEVFEAGFVRVEADTPHEMFVWPYFAAYPVEALSPRQIVELFKLVYVGDYEDMRAYGVYTSFRAGIAPDGTWQFFFTD